MVWLVDEAIRSRGLPGDVGHSDKLLLHTKTHTKIHTIHTPRRGNCTHTSSMLRHNIGKVFFPWMGRLFVKLESFWISLTLTSKGGIGLIRHHENSQTPTINSPTNVVMFHKKAALSCFGPQSFCTPTPHPLFFAQ